MKYLAILSFLFVIFNCKQMDSYSYSPHKKIEFKFNFKESKYIKKHKSTFLYFNLEIKNDSTEKVYFDPSLLKVEINGKVNKSTYYNSLASVMPEKVHLNEGINKFNLYFVIQGKMNLNSIQEFHVIKFGLDK